LTNEIDLLLCRLSDYKGTTSGLISLEPGRRAFDLHPLIWDPAPWSLRFSISLVVSLRYSFV